MKTANLLPDYIESFGFPITLAFAPDGRVYYTERITGNLWEFSEDNFRLVKSFPILKITGHHETGLIGLALDPDFEENEYLYCYYTYIPLDNPSEYKNRVVRLKSDGTEEETLLENIPAGLIHNGGILAFGPDKTLFIGVGVGNQVKERAQEVKALDGKVLRIKRDGSLPADNPFPGSPVFSYGHRNIFGLAFHPLTGKLYIAEEGPEKDDEINIVEEGGNYGWPEVTGATKDPRFIDPIMTYTPTITPTQAVFVGNDFYFGSYNEGTVHKLSLKGEKFDQVAKDEIVYRGKTFGVLGVFFGPDKNFYITRPDRILRISLGSF